ncbi:MAG: glycosyltransferase family 9 protein [Bacteroidia bacterium]|nr:glycosyltransferase family 9 protein [Bacteroidia bacterium]
MVAQTAFLGDAVLGLSVVQALQKAFPDADIRYLVRKGNESIVPGPVFVWDKRRRKYEHFFQTLVQIRRFRPELFVVVQRYFSSGLMAMLSGAQTIVGFDKNPFSCAFTFRVAHRLDGRHELERNAELLKPLGIVGWERPKIRVEDSNVPAEPYVVLAPATVWATKAWAYWPELARALAQKKRVYVVGAPGEREICARVAGDWAVNLAGELTLPQLAGLMRGALRVFCNDSAPLHIAGAVNAPVTVFFCSTVPAFGFGPISDDAVVLEARELQCRPCGLHGRKRCPKGHFRCAKEIGVAAAVRTLGLE